MRFVVQGIGWRITPRAPDPSTSSGQAGQAGQADTKYHKGSDEERGKMVMGESFRLRTGGDGSEAY